MPTPFSALLAVCSEIENTKKRGAMISLAARFIAALKEEEIEPAVSMMLGRPFPRGSQAALDVSWSTLASVIKRITGIQWDEFKRIYSRSGDVGSAVKDSFEFSPKRQTLLFRSDLTILGVRRLFEGISGTAGAGSRERKERLIEALLSQASPLEAKYLVRIFLGEMRIGFGDGLMEQVVARAFGLPLAAVQKASMIAGDIAGVAAAARSGGIQGVSAASFQVFKPISPMLAQTSESLEDALLEHGGRTAFEYKYDGARVQIHKSGGAVRLFSRSLTDVTASLPEIANTARSEIRTGEAILEGEVVAVGGSGRPYPFQHLMRRLTRVHGIGSESEKIPLKLYLFDAIYVDGTSLVSKAYHERRRILSGIAGRIELARQLVTGSLGEASVFLSDAIGAGHEGVIAKRPDSDYTPGKRGKKWLKIKPVLDPLDLVIVAAEWGYGRRRGWLSDYHLAARDADKGKFLEVGKTFKGLNDKEMGEMTRRLQEISIEGTRGGVAVFPKIIVEVYYNEIQMSPKYASGMALRFARINRIRDDKSPDQADTIQRVREIFERQFLKKGRL